MLSNSQIRKKIRAHFQLSCNTLRIACIYQCGPPKGFWPQIGPAPVLLTYPKETVVAEKFEAMVKLGIANSRMKDFHDLRTLSDLFPFEGAVLSDAIKRTFARRKTALPATERPIAFTLEFFEDEEKKRQWSAFVAKNKLWIASISLEEVVAAIERFVMPVLTSINTSEELRWSWAPGGPWVAEKRTAT